MVMNTRNVPGAGNTAVNQLPLHLLLLVSCVRLFCDTMDCSPPGSSVYGIFLARILQWIAIPFSRGSSQPRDQTWVSYIAGRFFTIRATREWLQILCYPTHWEGDPSSLPLKSGLALVTCVARRMCHPELKMPCSISSGLLECSLWEPWTAL